ncbi:MAG: hypothetical protein M0Q42_10415 [Xanthomonadales bacterium]|nr:hypothetical protein [Xanthomonadales bacterium]
MKPSILRISRFCAVLFGPALCISNEAVASYYLENAIPAGSFARCVLFAMSQPEEVDINEILFRPTKQDL